MKVLFVSFMVLVLGGLVGCNSIPFLSAKNQLESIIGVAASGIYTVTVTKDDNILYTETWNCTKDEVTGKLSGCHKISASTTTPIK